MPAVERSNSRFSFVPAVASWGAVGVADGHCWAAETGGEWLPRASVKAVTYRAVTGAADDDAIAGGWRATTSMCRSSLPSPQCFRSTERYWWKPREQSEMRVDFRDRFRGRFCAIMRQRRISCGTHPWQPLRFYLSILFPPDAQGEQQPNRDPLDFSSRHRDPREFSSAITSAVIPETSHLSFSPRGRTVSKISIYAIIHF